MTRFVVTAMVSALFAGSAMAQCSGTKAEAVVAKDGDAKKSCCMDDKSGKTACAKTCSGEAVAALPAMKYKVGDQTVCCPTMAKELAKGDEKAIKFVVADKTFDKQPGFRFYEYELRGVPVRVEIGPKDLVQNACVLGRRDVPGKEGKEKPIAGLKILPRKIESFFHPIRIHSCKGRRPPRFCELGLNAFIDAGG